MTVVLPDGTTTVGMIRSTTDTGVSLLVADSISRRSRLVMSVRELIYPPPSEYTVKVLSCEAGGSGRFFYVVELDILSVRNRLIRSGSSATRQGLSSLVEWLVRPARP